MKATIVDLRYKMKEVLQAINRNESVDVLYHGNKKAVILPLNLKKQKKVKDHALFGCRKDDAFSVQEMMNRLRGGRFNDL